MTDEIIESGNYKFTIYEADEGRWIVHSIHDTHEEFEFDEISFERARDLAINAGKFWTLCDNAEGPIWKSFQNYWKFHRDTSEEFDQFVFRVLDSIKNKVREKAGWNLDSLLEEE